MSSTSARDSTRKWPSPSGLDTLAVDELLAVADGFEGNGERHDESAPYAMLARERAETLLVELCDAATDDAGLTADLSEQAVPVAGAAMPARDFVCDLDRLGHDVREFASPGSLADDSGVTFRVAQRAGGPFDFAVLQRAEAIPGQMVLVGAALGDALQRESVGIAEWDAYTSVLMCMQREASASAQRSVFSKLREATVWIVFPHPIACSSGERPPCFGAASGTGAFKSPNLVLTNAHVVEITDEAGSFAELAETGFFASREFGVRPVRLVKNARRRTSSREDAAVIEILDCESPTLLSFSQN